MNQFCSSIGFNRISLVLASGETFERKFEGGLFPGRAVLLASRFAPTRPVTLWYAPSRPARGMAGFWTLKIVPGNALHEKRLQKQINEGIMVSRQEQRALFVALINCGLSAEKPVVNCSFQDKLESSSGCSTVGFEDESESLCFRRNIQDRCFGYPGVHQDHICPGRAESTSLLARPRDA